MAYLSKTACNDIYETWTNIIRYICGDSSTLGRDWQIKRYTVNEDDPSNVQYKNYSGTLTSVTLDTPIELPTISVEEETFTYAGSDLVEGTDYTIDRPLGKVTFLSGGSVPDGADVDYSYKFKRAEYVLYNTDGSEEVVIKMKFQIWEQETEAHIRLGAAYSIDDSGNLTLENDTNFAISFWNNPNNLWVFSNQRRIIIVVESEGFYSIGYAGLTLRLCLPDEYKYPFVLTASHRCKYDYSEAWWHDEQDKAYFPLHRGYAYFDDTATWNVIDEYACYYVQPYVQLKIDNSIQINYPSGFPKFFYPIIVAPSWDYLVGAYQGIYYVPASDFTSETTITDTEGHSYIVFPSVYRNDHRFWHAILEE